jgi:acyl-coenzyme A synthetase/AMP-(fatty) acid ligase
MSIALYEIVLALLKIGAVAVFVDPWVRIDRIAELASAAAPQAFIAPGWIQGLRWFQKPLRRLPLTVSLGSTCFGLLAKHTLSGLIEKQQPSKLAEMGSGDPAMISFTTGSGGKPKGVERTHGFLKAQHEALQSEIGIPARQTVMTNFPVFALSHLAQGDTTVIPAVSLSRLERLRGKDLFSQLEKYHVDSLAASPILADKLANFGKRKNRTLPGIKTIISGGAPINDEQIKQWQPLFPQAKILIAYGSTEAEPVALIAAEERLKLGQTAAGYPGICLGKPVSRIRAKIVRLQQAPIKLEAGAWAGWELPAGEIGELVVTGEHVNRGYLADELAVRENKIQDQTGCVWHRMGDTGYLDNEGRFWQVGRLHSTLLFKQPPLHPLLIEQMVMLHFPELSEAALVGFPDLHAGPQAYLAVRDKNRKVSTANVRQTLEELGHTIDRVIRVSQPFPKDARHHAKHDYPALLVLLKRSINADQV